MYMSNKDLVNLKLVSLVFWKFPTHRLLNFSIQQLDYEIKISIIADETAITSRQQLRVNNVIVLVETNLCSIHVYNCYEKRSIALAFTAKN